MTTNSFVQIRCRKGSLAGQTFCFIEPGMAPLPNPLRFGRQKDAHVRFTGDHETMVSRLHAELSYDGATCNLQDAGSSFGIFLVPSQERVSRLSIQPGSNLDVQFGPQGPICHISLGGAIPFGSYFLTNKLGEGGMGEVFVGWDTRLNRQVVLKLLREEMLGELDDAQDLLRNEARILSQLEHPNVVRVYELWAQDSILYLAMEYIRGITVSELRRSNGFFEQRLLPTLAAAILHQVCMGLHAAHQLPIQVVHRDISPNNIMITTESIKVIDFGLARASNRVGKSITEGGRIAGCPPYMSPEQIKTPQCVDRRSDIFSVGAVLYQLCTGVSPFSRENAPATMAAVLNHDPPRLRTLCTGASEGLEKIVHTALCKDPAGRQATAGELAAQLQEEIGQDFASHAGIVRYLRSLGLDLQGAVPEPLISEPQIVQRGRQRQRQQQRTTEHKPALATPVPNLEGRTIGNGRYRLGKRLSRTPIQGTHLAWKQHFLAEDTTLSGNGAEVVVTICGGLNANNALSQVQTARIYQYIAHRLKLGPTASLPAVLEHGEAWSEGPVYVVTPYLPVRVSQLTPGTLAVKEALQVVAQTACALLAEQKRDPTYVHGDIRPENIALESQDPGRNRALLLDFSLGSVLHLPLAQNVNDLPSPYLPPRQGDDTQSSPATDVFALGMVFYWLCGGDVAKAQQCLEDDSELPSLPATAQAAAETDAVTALFGALKADPGMRPSLSELSEILDAAVLRHNPTIAPTGSDVRATATPQAVTASALEAPRAVLRLAERLPAQTLPFGRNGRIHVQSLCVNLRELREPVVLPFNLQGLLEGNQFPLMLEPKVHSVELRVCAEALNAGRAVRIYSEVAGSAARNSYALPGDFSEKQLFIGHHRGLLHTIYLSRRSDRTAEPLRRIALPQLGLDLEIPGTAGSVLTLWRAVPQSAEIHLTTVLVNDT